MDRALRHTLAVIRSDASNVEAFVVRGQAFLLSGDCGAALSLFKEVQRVVVGLVLMFTVVCRWLVGWLVVVVVVVVGGGGVVSVFVGGVFLVLRFSFEPPSPCQSSISCFPPEVPSLQNFDVHSTGYLPSYV